MVLLTRRKDRTGCSLRPCYMYMYIMYICIYMLYGIQDPRPYCVDTHYRISRSVSCTTHTRNYKHRLPLEVTMPLSMLTATVTNQNCTHYSSYTFGTTIQPQQMPHPHSHPGSRRTEHYVTCI